MQPFDYTLQVQQPFQSAVQGFQIGSAIQKQQEQAAALEAQKRAQAQMQMDLANLAGNRSATAADYAAMMTRYPQLSEQLKRASETMTGDQQQAFIRGASPILAALQNQRPDVAEKLLRDSAQAKRNSGMEEEAKQDEMLAEMTKLNPDIARSGIAFRLSALPGGDKLIDSIGKMGQEDRAAAKAPAELRKANADAVAAEADATTKGVTAQFAERNALADLETKGWNVKALQADIRYKDQSTRIAAMNAAIAREGNDLKKEELRLKVAEATDKLNTAVRERVAEFDSGMSNIDAAKTLIAEIRQSPTALYLATGATAGTGYIPGTATRTVAGKLEQLQNTLAAANLDKLKGAMSDKDIAFLKNIATNLDRNQRPEDVVAELAKIEGALDRGAKGLAKKYGAPERAPTVAPGSRPPLESFQR